MQGASLNRVCGCFRLFLDMREEWEKNGYGERFRSGEGELERMLLTCKITKRRLEVELVVVADHTLILK